VWDYWTPFGAFLPNRLKLLCKMVGFKPQKLNYEVGWGYPKFM